MMIGKSIPEYVFIKTAIAALQLVAPLNLLWVTWSLLAPAPPRIDPKWEPLYSCLLFYAHLEAVFFISVYLPRRYHLQKAATHPKLSLEERQALFEKCIAYPRSGDFQAGWFFPSRSFHKENVVEWLLWAFFSTSMDTNWEIWADEIEEYLAAIQNTLGLTLLDGYNKDAACMKVTLDPVRMTHRPLFWYLVVGVIDFLISLRLHLLGFRHYSDKRLFQSFPPRLFTFFSRPSNVEGLSYWYKPHHSHQGTPVLFLHGIGIGLQPYACFLADLASQNPDVGIVVPEFLSISSRITRAPLSRNATVTAIQRILDTHSLSRVVIASHSYGTGITTHLLRSPDMAPRIAAMLLIDPIPFLLHLPCVSYNFVYRSPRTANEWLLWYFASQDPDVSRTLARHFFWSEIILFKDDIRDKRVAVALAGQDQVVDTEEVRKYLTGENEREAYWKGGSLEVLCYPELDHAMIFQTKARRERLMRVMARFIREEL